MFDITRNLMIAAAILIVAAIIYVRYGIGEGEITSTMPTPPPIQQQAPVK